MFYLIGAFAFIADRIFKIIALSYISSEGAVLIRNFFYFKFYKNFGAAFSLKIPVEIIILSSFLIIFFILLGVGYHAVSPRCATKTKAGYPTPQSKIQKYILLFLLLGAASNIFDRIYYGYVVDYFSFFNYSFFNIADLMIIFSLGSVLYCYWKK